jgi:hypothetical protein
MAGPIFPMPVPFVAAITSLRGAHRARLLVIIWLGATGLISVPFATEAQALGLVEAAGGCVACPAASSAAAPYSGERDNGYTVGPLAYATPGNDVVTRTENAITINDARPLEAPTQIRLHRFLQPYEVIKQFDRDAVLSRINEAPPNKKQPARRASPPPKDIGVTGLTLSPFVALPRIFTSVQPPLNPAPADAAQVANPPGPGQATSVTASQNVSAQALAVIAGALAGAAVGLFLISWLEIGGNFQVR